MKLKDAKNILRGELYYADFRPVNGSEQSGIRPALILQNNRGNRHSPTVIVAAVTGNVKKPELPTHILLKDEACGLRRPSTVLLEQLQTLDKSRLRSYIGRLSPAQMARVGRALTISLGMGK